MKILLPSSIKGKNTEIRGIKYLVYGFYNGDKNIQQRLGEIIKNDYEIQNTDEFLSDIALDNCQKI